MSRTRHAPVSRAIRGDRRGSGRDRLSRAPRGSQDVECRVRVEAVGVELVEAVCSRCGVVGDSLEAAAAHTRQDAPP